jgi:transcriptional regulator with XRE-family HTH domain
MAKLNGEQSLAAIDSHIGAYIRKRRKMLGLSQKQLAEMICVTSQQVIKYERGANRVSAGRLYDIACALNAPIASFYEGLGDRPPQTVAAHQHKVIEIVRNFSEIRNEKYQEALGQLARALAGHQRSTHQLTELDDSYVGRERLLHDHPSGAGSGKGQLDAAVLCPALARRI